MQIGALQALVGDLEQDAHFYRDFVQARRSGQAEWRTGFRRPDGDGRTNGGALKSVVLLLYLDQSK